MEGEEIIRALENDSEIYGGYDSDRKIGPPTHWEFQRRIIEKYGEDAWMYEPNARRSFGDGLKVLSEKTRAFEESIEESARITGRDLSVWLGYSLAD